MQERIDVDVSRQRKRRLRAGVVMALARRLRSLQSVRSMQPDRSTIFVYGTLLRGESNHRLLRGAAFVQETRSEPWFDLVDLGPFPAMIAGGCTAVLGEVYEVDRETLHRLDHLEGHPSFYVRTPIVLEQGLYAQTYLLGREHLHRGRRIPSGSWRARGEPTAGDGEPR